MNPEKPPLIKLSDSAISGLETQYLQEALALNELSYHGSFISKIQTYFEDLFEDKYVVPLNSGTSAIHLSLLMAGVKTNDEVLCQSFTYAATAFPITYIGAIPIFIGSEKQSWNMCPITLEEAIKERIKKHKKPSAIIAVHAYGMPCKMKEIMAIASKYDIPIIEDAAEALGSKIQAKWCGSLGHFGVLSFNTNKLVTSAGGGLLICSTEKEKNKAIYLASQAKSQRGGYNHEHIGFNYKMNNINASILAAQLEQLPRYLEQRRHIHDFYLNEIKSFSEIRLQQAYSQTVVSNFWLNCIVCENQEIKSRLIIKLKENNIEFRDLWKPMHLQPIFKKSRYYGNDFAENLFLTGLSLPSGNTLTSEELERIKQVFTSLC